MNIDRINKTNKVFQKKDLKPVRKKTDIKKKDKIQISEKARELALREKYINMIKQAPEPDNSERIKYLKEKINSEDYITQKMIEDLAKKLAESLGLTKE